MTNIICPKCKGNMSTYERNGIHVDQCDDCRGLFLDRGELEQLIAADSNWQAQAANQRQPERDDRRDDRRDDDRRDDGNRIQGFLNPGSSRDNNYNHKKRKRSFLEEMFD